MLTTHDDVIRALLRYTDWWQPSTSSVFRVGRRSGYASDGIRGGLLDTLPEREELSRRMSFLGDRDRRVLYLWYLRQLPVQDIARELKIGRRQCFRLRSNAVNTLVELGDPESAYGRPA
jgi:hypothetical protein